MAQLKPVAQSFHVRIRALHKFESIRNNPDWPSIGLGVFPGFEAKIEVTRVFRIYAESIDGSLWVRLRVGTQPGVWNSVSTGRCWPTQD